MAPGRGVGAYRRKNLLNKVLRESGFYGRKLKFRSRKKRLDYLVELFKPYAGQINRFEKHSITSWLKNQGLGEEEIKCFYDRVISSSISSIRKIYQMLKV